MKKFFALCVLALFMISPVMAHESHTATDKTVAPSELLMIHHSSCGFCKAFHRDIGIEKYNATKRGKALPLRIIDVSTNEGLGTYKAARKAKLIKRARGTPTFIIFYNNKEVGRVTGYEGKDGFLKRLDAEIKRAFELGGIPWISKMHAPR